MRAINKVKLHYSRYNCVNLSNLNFYFAIEKRIFQPKTRTFQCIPYRNIVLCNLYLLDLYVQSIYLQKQQTASSASGRPTSSSNSSVNLIQNSNAKGRMAESERGRGIGKGGVKSRETPSSNSGKLTNTSFNEDASNDT